MLNQGTGNISSSVFEGTNAVGSGAAYAFDSEHILYGRLRPYLNKVATPHLLDGVVQNLYQYDQEDKY